MEYPISMTVNELTLRGVAHKPEDRDNETTTPVVIMFHGFTGNKIESHFLFVRFARELQKAGIGCVRFDFSGSGESDGQFSDITFSGEVREGIEIVNMVKKLDWVDPHNIMLLGLSMGGAVATRVAKTIPEDIHKVCLWAPAGNMNERAKQYFTQYEVMSNGNIDLGGLVLGRGFYDDLKGRSLYEGLDAYTNPLLIVHGTNDVVIPHDNGLKYGEVYKQNDVKIHLIEGADHSFSQLDWIDELFDHSLRFLT